MSEIRAKYDDEFKKNAVRLSHVSLSERRQGSSQGSEYQFRDGLRMVKSLLLAVRIKQGLNIGFYIACKTMFNHFSSPRPGNTL